MKVLFVCTQNVGRSQMAAELYNKLTKTSDAASAGTAVGEPGQTLRERAAMSEGAQNVLTVLDEESIDIRDNIRTQLTEDMLNSYDPIIVMAERNTWPSYLEESDKTIYWDIADPRFKGLSSTRATRDEIKQKIISLITQK